MRNLPSDLLFVTSYPFPKIKQGQFYPIFNHHLSCLSWSHLFSIPVF